MDEEKKIFVRDAHVVNNRSLLHTIWEIVLEPTDFDVVDFMPGQFVCLEPLNKNSAMARPFSVSKISTFSNTFSLMYKVVGYNTDLLTTWHQGARLKFWGPLGNGFIPDPQSYEEVWLIGGGMGIAPLRFFEKVISEYQEGIAKVFYGAKSNGEIVELRLHSDYALSIATEDGSVGYHGLVTDLLNEKLLENDFQEILVITCGPKPMMQQVAEMCAATNTDCYVILERIMACGIGVCLGCSVKTTQGMKCICHDGPVFDAKEVMWDELG